jgi:hypothetical protein
MNEGKILFLQLKLFFLRKTKIFSGDLTQEANRKLFIGIIKNMYFSPYLPEPNFARKLRNALYRLTRFMRKLYLNFYRPYLTTNLNKTD